MRRYLGFALVGLLIAACAAPATSVGPTASGPGPSVGPTAPPEPTEVTIVYPSELTSRTPYSDSTNSAYSFWSGIYDTLADSDGFAFHPLLAESWESTDELTWQFHLNPAAKFADGTAVTADDVVFSFDRVINDPLSVQGGIVDDIAEVVAVDEATVEFVTTSPLIEPVILQLVSNRTIMSKAYFDRVGQEEADNTPNGTGPYELTEWRPGERYVLELRDDYWGLEGGLDHTSSVLEGKAPDRVIYRFISEPEAQVTALLNGEADLLWDVPLQFVQRIRDNPAFKVHDLPNPTHFFFVLNPISEPLKNADVRRAINHAIDVQGIIDGPVQGDATRLEAPVLPDSLDIPGITTYPYDPDKARELLAGAGYPDGFTIKFKCPSGQFLAEREICEAAAEMLRDVGLTVDIQHVEWSTFSTDYRTAADGTLGYEMFYIRATGSTRTDVGMYDSWFECSDRVAYCQNTERGQEFADLYSEAKGTTDDDARAETFREAFKVLMDDPPIVPLFLYNNHFGVSSKLTFEPPYSTVPTIQQMYANE